MNTEELKPLMVFKNTWYQGLKDGLIILLSAEHTDSTAFPNEFKRGKDEYLWKVAFSYFGAGCQLRELYAEEILKCEYMGYLKECRTDRKVEFEGKK